MHRDFELVEANALGRLAGDVLAPNFRLHVDSSPDTDRVVDGRIVEQWLVSDGVGLLQQLGKMPAPAG